MTALDDALNSSAVVWTPPDLTVIWKESSPSEGDGVENLEELSDMLDGDFEVEQSFDDALPDPVTMTGSNDASGTLTAGLLGREGQVLASSTTTGTTVVAGSSVGTFVAPGLPSGAQHGDYVVVAIVVPDKTAQVQEQYDQDQSRRWTKLSEVIDGNYKFCAYGRYYYTGMDSPYFFWFTEVGPIQNPVWGTTAYRATAPNGAKLAWKISQTYTAAVGASTSAHPLGTYDVPTRGYAQAFFAGPPSITYTNTGAGTIPSQANTTSVSMALVRTTLNTTSPQYSQALSITSSAALTDGMIFGFVIEPFARPRMTPTQFWSPFNKDSPVYGYERDTARVDFYQNTMTDAAGVEPTHLFSGLMNDIEVKSGGSDVELSAVSRTRINLNRSVNLPMVFGRREGLTVDWLVTWLLARADRFFGPAPSYMARYWAPMYGSIHAVQDAFNGYNFVMYWNAKDGNNIGKRYPEVIEGPFHTAMFACQRTDLVQRIVISAKDLYKSTEMVPPWVTENYASYQYLVPQWGWNGGAGRVSFWIKADPWASTGLPGTASNFLMNFYTQVRDKTGAVLGKIGFWISNDGVPAMGMGNDSAGFAAYNFNSYTLPQDGQWHFYSVYWSWFDGEMGIKKDNTKTFSTVWDGVNNTTPNWVSSDQEFYDAGGKVENEAYFQLPVSDFLIESGYEVYNLYFSDQWPATPWPGFTATTRPTYAPMEAIASEVPVNAWDTLADLARNTMSWYRANEEDEVEFYPLTYWGELAQNTPDEVVDTEVNAQDLGVVVDPSKSRNVITVSYTDTKVDEWYSPALELSSSYEIPRGNSVQTFTLDVPIAEIHGASDPYAAWWTLTNGTGAQVTAGTQPSNVHYMFVNDKPDGTGYYWNNTVVTARILSFTQTTVTLAFTNKYKASMYLVNNYQGDNSLPFMRILGYVTRMTDGYVTQRDAGSIGTRRERSLEVEMAWVHTRDRATEIASNMASLLARPRHEVEIVVSGDPRRKPGDLVTIKDAQATQAAGNWRVLKVVHTGNGAQFTQKLQLVSVLPVGVWDVTAWDESIWGE